MKLQMRLKKWALPQCYVGEHWDDYYSAGVGRSRDSEPLEESNFAVTLRKLGGESETVIVVRENHWAVGWVEWIAIHENDVGALAIAGQLAERREDYSVLDESDWSEREDEACRQVWEECLNQGERVHYLRSHSYTGGFSDLLKAVRGSWYHAANILNSPNDIIC
jgi:hypothetical protein